jgi:hypothetical protein
VLIFALVVLLQTPPVQGVTPEDPGKLAEVKSWSGCVQAGSTPSTYRLNLDRGTAVAGPDDPASLGDPFLQLLGTRSDSISPVTSASTCA